jgi:hypothetical protein
MNDTLHLATDNGSHTVDLKSLLDKKEWVKGITFDELRIPNSPYNNSGFKTKDLLQLSANENNLNLFFSTNPPPYRYKLFYEYRLNNDADWVTMEAQRIDLNYLSPDRYQLNIYVTNVSTGQVFEQQLLNFEIAAPFYMKWWFIISTGFFL